MFIINAISAKLNNLMLQNDDIKPFVFEGYEKSEDLTSSILPAKSESLHKCEMKKKVGR